MKFIKETRVEQLGVKKRYYSLEKKLSAKQKIYFFSKVASSRQISESFVDAGGDEVGAGRFFLHYPLTSIQEWLKKCVEEEVTVTKCTVKVNGRKCDFYFDHNNNLVLYTQIDDSYHYEKIAEDALNKLTKHSRKNGNHKHSNNNAR